MSQALPTLPQVFCIVHEFDINKSQNNGGYNLLPAGHPGNSKRDDVFFQQKQILSLHSLSVSHLPEYLVCEVTVQNKKGSFITYYCSKSQIHDTFQIFLQNFEKLLSISEKSQIYYNNG